MKAIISLGLTLASAMLLTSCINSADKTEGERATAESPAAERIPEIKTREIRYKADGKTMVGYLAMPAGTQGRIPGVLVVHEWWGQTDYPRRRARELAELGYAGFAVDMYGDRALADHPKKAGEFTQKVMNDAETVGSRFKAAMKALEKQKNVDSDEIAAIGYCFGGSVVLEMMRQGVDLEGVVSFHGGLNTPSTADPESTETEVLVLNGSQDPMVTAEDIKNFKQEMEAAGVNYQFISFRGAKHGFTNPDATEYGEKYDLPLAYNEEADRKSWQKMQEFLKKVLK